VAATVFTLAPLHNLTVTGPQGPLGELFNIGEIEVDVPSPEASAAMRPETPLEQRLADITLFGYSLRPTAVQAGEAVDLDLFWRAEGSLEAKSISITVEDAAGNLVAGVEEPPLGEAYPFNRWRPGEAFHDIHRVPIAARASPGPSRIAISLLSSDGSRVGAPLRLSGPEIRSRPHQFEAPPGLQAVGVEIGGIGRLEGFTAPERPPAGAWSISLVWRGLSEGDSSYSVTVQLLDETGQVVAQHDGAPSEGTAPTSSWLTGEVVIDKHTLALPTLGPGRYTLIAAMYNPNTGQRLRANGGDHVVLGEYWVP
jgi:hypothetical protein